MGSVLLLKTTEKKFNNTNTSEEALKNANWEVVEYQTLIQQAQSILATLETVLATLNPTTCTNRIFQRARVTLKDLKIELYQNEPIQEETNLSIACPGFHAV